MTPFAAWLFKSAVWLSGFALVYLIFLRNERYFKLKRIYLLTGILFALVFPLVSFHYIKVVAPPVAQAENLLVTSTGPEMSLAGVPSEFHFNYKLILLIIYLSGIFWLAVRALKNYSGLFGSIKNAKPTDIGKIKVIRAEQYRSAFSFFNYVFINPSISEKEAEEIMNHELVHVRQRHWFDLLLVEILRMVQWVNPFAWIYTGFIRLNHEYLADQAALQRTSSPATYRAALMNQLFDSPVISLSNSFNYSLNKKRFDMMKQIFTSPWRKLKILCILPVTAVIFYAFATPKYRYSDNPPVSSSFSASITEQQQQPIKGIVVDEQGNPVNEARLMTSGRLGQSSMVMTKADGSFLIPDVGSEATINIFREGFISATAKPDFKNEMRIILQKDPAYKKKLTILDGKPTDRTVSGIFATPGFVVARLTELTPEQAISKYGDAGRNGAIEVVSAEKAKELGIKLPFRREKPEDFPTFNGGNINSFTSYIIKKVKYPDEATKSGMQGRISVTITIEPDGTISKTEVMGSPYKQLSEVVINSIKAAPKWTPAINPLAREDTYVTYVNVKFLLPDKVTEDDAYVVVDKAPDYPGGPTALLKFIAENTLYPDSAKNANIQGRVIVRFVIRTDGNIEDATVLKGVHPLLDNEAIRVVSQLKGFTPGTQNGKAVPVYYMVPITFATGRGNPGNNNPAVEEQRITGNKDSGSGNNSVPPSPQTRVVTPDMPVFLDGIETTKKTNELYKDLGHNFGTIKILSSEEATKKYGDKGSKGVIDVFSRKKALELGMKVPYPRISPEDYPTFRGEPRGSFEDWIISQLKYPPDALSGGISGTVRLIYQIAPDGTLINPQLQGKADRLLADALIKVVAGSPKWDPPKNAEARDTFSSMVTLRFELPDKIFVPVEPFVVVMQQPVFPGGEAALLDYIARNIKYPEAAKKNQISGRVIVRFVITAEGSIDQISVLKGVDPLLDAEAIRVISTLPKFQPGYQSGKAVPVWYMVPVAFYLNGMKPVFSMGSENKIMRFLAQTTTYPQEAKAASDTGNIFIQVRTDIGGAIIETRRLTDISGISLPTLPQVVIVGYKNSANYSIQGPPVKTENNMYLFNEALRVTKQIPGLSLPECNEKPLDFVVAFKFILK